MKRLTQIMFAPEVEIDQSGDSPALERINSLFYLIFGIDCEIDWRDETEVWITHETEQIIDGSWRLHI